MDHCLYGFLTNPNIYEYPYKKSLLHEPMYRYYALFFEFYVIVERIDPLNTISEEFNIKIKKSL